MHSSSSAESRRSSETARVLGAAPSRLMPPRGGRPPETGTGFEAGTTETSYLHLAESRAVPSPQDRNEVSRLDSRSIEELTTHIHQSDDHVAVSHRRASHARSPLPVQPAGAGAGADVATSQWITEFYTVSHLVLFAIFGTLARLGLQALTFYPAAPALFSSVWPNFAGTLIIGFLTEDRMLFRHGGVTSSSTHHHQLAEGDKDEEAGPPHPERTASDIATAKKAHLAVKKTIPLYIGLATGFCGSFTSFSSFIRDSFLALSNDLPTPSGADTARNGGYSFLALLAVVIGTVSLSFSGFYIGAHLADALAPMTPTLWYPSSARVINPLATVLGWGSWIGAIILSVVPPDRYSNPGASELWRGRATFALVFAPLGCVVRFYASARLNGQFAAFPLGTFAVNVAGTAVLGLAWDLAHVPKGGIVGCQVLQGIEDGFCGCLTTVSTWVVELVVLRRRKAYIYGGTSVVSALLLLIAIMGGFRWAHGLSDPLCTH